MSAVVLTFSHLSTRFLGLDRTVRMFQWLGRKTRVRREPMRDEARAVAERALQGLNVLPMRVECLDQAIAVWFSLNRRGYPAVLNIGMRLSPLSGHAWVTCEDETFVVTPGLEDFTVIAAYEPWVAGAS